MDVNFVVQRGRPFSIEVGFFDTILEIKGKVNRYQGIPISNQTLIFNGQILQDNDDIWKCAIFQNSCIHLIDATTNFDHHQQPTDHSALVGGRNDTAVSHVSEAMIGVTGQAMEAMTEAQAFQDDANIENASSDDVWMNLCNMIDRFNNANPPSFEGNYNPNGAQRWLEEIENIFQSISCPMNLQVQMAEFMLTGEAKNWWRIAHRRLERRGVEITWVVFRYEFLIKYKEVKLE